MRKCVEKTCARLSGENRAQCSPCVELLGRRGVGAGIGPGVGRGVTALATIPCDDASDGQPGREDDRLRGAGDEVALDHPVRGAIRGHRHRPLGRLPVLVRPADDPFRQHSSRGGSVAVEERRLAGGEVVGPQQVAGGERGHRHPWGRGARGAGGLGDVAVAGNEEDGERQRRDDAHGNSVLRGTRRHRGIPLQTTQNYARKS